MLLLDLDRIFDNDHLGVPSIPDLTADDLSEEWRKVYEERAAIREYDGGLPREIAEHHALLDTLALMKAETRR